MAARLDDPALCVCKINAHACCSELTEQSLSILQRLFANAALSKGQQADMNSESMMMVKSLFARWQDGGRGHGLACAVNQIL